ncbi:MAG: hypothetical protein GF388_10685, partial [Candidatus Aegiribacteria sp.]|nr:hypothetical protein [Candidatus Aegiribacteria sp.]MBD3295482.1 hypothetical protein [Candidatus Fermentibacteria bacterium]
MFRILLPLIVSTLLLTISCGDSTGPSDSTVSSSELTVTFTGSTGKSATLSSEAVTMAFSGDQKSICRVTASWTMCTDQGFQQYQLYRSETPGIQNNTASATLVATIDNALTTNYSDEDVTWNTGYYYALRNTGEGSSAWSN